MQSSANSNRKAPTQTPYSRLDRMQDKGPKFEAFFCSALIGLQQRSKAVGRQFDQKR
jgi:hypothetical protein